MLAAAARLRDDDRIGEVRTETGAQAGQRLGDVAPNVRDVAGAGAGITAAALHLTAADGADPKALAADLAKELDASAAEPVVCSVSREQRVALMQALSKQLTFEQPARIWFDRDEDMTAALETLRQDRRVGTVEGRTKAEAYEEAKEIFRDDPEMLELLSPQALPAAVHITAAPGVEMDDLASDLAGTLPGAEPAATELPRTSAPRRWNPPLTAPARVYLNRGHASLERGHASLERGRARGSGEQAAD